MAAVIEARALTKHYGQVLAVRSLDLEVQEGEIFGFLGPNGAGKTTTIRILTGFIRATGGGARVLGMDCWTETIGVKARIGFLPDAPSLYRNLSGLELLDYLATLQGRESLLRQRMCDSLELSRADLRRKIKGYSHGMVQKLAIIQATQHDPDLLIMDEPTESLDPLVQQAFFEVLQEFHARGRTIFFSSHNLPEVEHLCSRVAIIREGELVAVEEVRELRRRKRRVMEVLVAGDVPDGALNLPGVVSLERDGRRMRFTVRGDINPVVRALARLDLEDVVFEEPHLEDIFMDYYRTQKEGE